MENTNLKKFLNFELSSNEEKAFKKTETYKQFQKTLELFENSKATPFDGEALLSKINNDKNKQPNVISLFKKWIPISIAASILLCCSMVYFYLQKPISYETVVAESLNLSLPDESEVWLNAKSEISYNKDWENSRDIDLNGEAYFEVAKGKKFTVTTAQGTVTVLGTKFNVKNRDHIFEVHCFEGSVAVNYNNIKTILKPNDVFTSQKKKIKNSSVKKPDWTFKKSVFSNTDLSNVLKDISLHYNVSFKQNSMLKQQPLNYTGSYHYSDDINVVIEVLCKSLNLDYEIKNNVVFLNIEE